MKMRIGMIGTGRIARFFVQEAAAVETLSIAIVYNPNIGSAERFAKEWEIAAYTDNLEEIAAQVEGVYIATPHETHYEYAKWMLNRGIHVLCEKPMVLCGRQARELYHLAGEKGCVLMEAVKTAYCPGYQAMIETAKSGVIGTICDVEACFSRLTPTNVRELVDLEYGGSFTELGTYPMLPLFQLLGTEYKDVRFQFLLAGNGLDAYTKAEFEYEEACGLAKTGLLVKSEGQLVIAGTKGYILAKSPWWQTREFEVRFEDPNRREVHTFEYAGRGLRYETAAFVKAVFGENTRKVTPEVSIRMAETMEKLLSARSSRMNGYSYWKAAREAGQKPIPKEHPVIHAPSGAGAQLELRVARQCIPKGNPVVQASAGQYIKIWAHRGMSYAYPENTLEAFEAAAKLRGITGIELDVQLSKDGEIVVIHDEKVDRTTEGSGAVGDFTLEELQRLRIRKSVCGISRIPSLEEVFALLKPYCLQNGLLVNIELKNSIVRYKGLEQKVLDLVNRRGLKDYVWFSSFLPESMKLVKELEPEAKTGVLAITLEECITYCKAARADALHPYTGGLNVKLPEEMEGMPVRAWNVGEPLYGQDSGFSEKDLTRYAGYGVTDVFTNVPERYVKDTVS